MAPHGAPTLTRRFTGRPCGDRRATVESPDVLTAILATWRTPALFYDRTMTTVRRSVVRECSIRPDTGIFGLTPCDGPTDNRVECEPWRADAAHGAMLTRGGGDP